MEGLNKLERAVLDLLLEYAILETSLVGKDQIIQTLKIQGSKVYVKDREYTGYGFICHLGVPIGTPLVNGNYSISGAHGDLDGMKMGASFVLFVNDGQIDELVGTTYGNERWPEKIGMFSLRYIPETKI